MPNMNSIAPASVKYMWRPLSRPSIHTMNTWPIMINESSVIAAVFRGSLEDLSTVISCAAEANQLLTEVKVLVDLSWFYLLVDRRRCLEVAERGLVRSRALDDDVMAALAQGNSASLNLYLRGWRDEDADHCRLALKMTGDARDPVIVMRRCAIRIVLAFMNSNYREGCVAAEQGQAMAQERGDAYSFIMFNAFGAGFSLHLGAWREMQQSFAAALAVTKKNANRLGTPSRLHVAWLHNEALDFEGARKCCEEALNSAVEENPLIFFLGRNLLAKASLGLHDYPAALAQFNAITDRIEADGNYRNLLYPLFHHGFCEYWLAVGDLNRAREQATRLHDISTIFSDMFLVSIATQPLKLHASLPVRCETRSIVVPPQSETRLIGFKCR